MNRHWKTVHVRINDSATGQPTPVRIRFEAEGEFLAPLGRVTHFHEQRGASVGGHLRQGKQKYVYVDGSCEIPLPPGEILIEVLKGPEYAPIQETIQLSPGKMAIRLTMQRWTNLRAEGWFSGETNALYLDPASALLEGMAEDLAVVQLLAFQDQTDPEGPTALPNLLSFSGQESALEKPGHLVAVGTRNEHPELGTLSLLHSHRVVHPLQFGGPNGSEDWSLADWCEQCHRKNGLVIWTDPKTSRLRGEALANLILGAIDGYEMTGAFDLEPESLQEWYQLLNAGLRVPLVGGSAKDSNRTALGAMRTYAHLGANAELSYGNWIEAVRAGKTFVTNGPLLSLHVDGEKPGAILKRERGQSVRIETDMNSRFPVECVELLVNGEVIALKEPSGDRQAAQFEVDHVMEKGCWIALRCWSEDRQADDQITFAHTSPVYVELPGESYQAEENALASLEDHLKQTLRWVREEGRYQLERSREHLEGIFESALAKLRT